MDNRYPDRHAIPRLPRHPTRRALIASAAGLLLAAGSAAGFLVEDAEARRRVRKRRRNRNHNRSKENSISIPGEPGEPGEDGEPQPDSET